MGFLDKLKSTAGNAMAAASDAARNVQDKGKEMTEKARLNKAIKNEESKINNLYIYIIRFLQVQFAIKEVKYKFSNNYNKISENIIL